MKLIFCYFNVRSNSQRIVCVIGFVSHENVSNVSFLNVQLHNLYTKINKYQLN